MEERLEREKSFHDQSYATDARAVLSSYYAITDVCWRHYREFINGRAPGRRLLEYGCGQGGYTFRLAEKGAFVKGIDLSEVAIAAARRTAEEKRIPIDFQVMDAERLTFPDESFDLIYGAGILHHLDLERSLGELARALTPRGEAIFLEPLGHNPFLNLYRKLTRQLRTEDEHPLRWPDLRQADRHFGSVECRFFNLTTLFAVPLLKFPSLPGLPRLFALLHAVDRLLFRRIPFLRRYAWNVAMILSDPRRPPPLTQS
ncbi:MAG: class I SAM-dependent methyltransferase [Blastocatellia bacterium]|nr:class I SAM-dependent methyltransferase [Blastocatellia bacterium]